MKLKKETAIYAIVDCRGQLVKKPAGNRFYVSEFHAQKQCGYYNDPNIGVYHKPDGGRNAPYRVVRFRIELDDAYCNSNGGIENEYNPE